WTWSAWLKHSGGLDRDPDHSADADLAGGRSRGFQKRNRRLDTSMLATASDRPDGRRFGGFFESAAQGVEISYVRRATFLVVSKTPFHRALCLVADRCETTDLRAGRSSTPVAALECQARQRPDCATMAAY